jgi:hypothetical protein
MINAMTFCSYIIITFDFFIIPFTERWMDVFKGLRCYQTDIHKVLVNERT